MQIDNIIKNKLKILHTVQCSYMYKFNEIPLNVGETVILSYIVIDKHCSKPRNCNQEGYKEGSSTIFLHHFQSPYQTSNDRFNEPITDQNQFQ